MKDINYYADFFSKSENNTYKNYLVAVKDNGLALQFVKIKTPLLCYLATKQNGMAIKYVDNYSRLTKFWSTICLIAVKQCGNALKYVDKATQETKLGKKICYEAVKNAGNAIIWVFNQTPKLCELAISYDSDNIQYIDNQTEQLCLEAVTKDGLSIQHILTPTEKVCMTAIKQNYTAIKYIKKEHITHKVLNYGVKQCLNILDYIDKDLIKSININSDKEYYIKVIMYNLNNNITKYVRSHLELSKYITTIYDGIVEVDSLVEIDSLVEVNTLDKVDKLDQNKYYLIKNNNLYDIYEFQKSNSLEKGWLLNYQVEKFVPVKLCSCEEFVFI
jgi:hypothetical protein